MGDTVIVHFTNDLPEATTIDWHGVRVPSAMDGSQAVAAPIPPGGTFDYQFTVLDAGTFWYHPHIRSEEQVGLGLYGAIIVRDPAEALPVAIDELVVLSDVLVNPITGEPKEARNMRTAMMGVEGNLVLVNGSRSNLGVSGRAGEGRRWRIVNAAASRYFRLALEGGSMVRIGGDGGLLEAPVAVEEVLLVPGERADLVVWADAPSSTAVLRALPYERADGAGATEAVDVVRLVTTADAPVTPPLLPAALRTISALPAAATTREVELSERMEHPDVIFLLNGEAYPDVPTVGVTLGTVERWEIVNDSDMDHPFHVHGFFFQLETSREWKDTINVPTGARVPILVDFADRAGAAGAWMYHCHILGHAEGGMMAALTAQ